MENSYHGKIWSFTASADSRSYSSVITLLAKLINTQIYFKRTTNNVLNTPNAVITLKKGVIFNERQ